MSDATQNPRFKGDPDNLVPPAVVRALTALVLVILGVVTLAVMLGRAPSSTPPVAAVERSVSLYLTSDMSGAAKVLDASGTLIADLSSDEGGFVAGVDRVIRFERDKAGLPGDGPVLLEAYENGRMAIIDPATGWRADLMGFGQDNAGAFAKLLAYN